MVSVQSLTCVLIVSPLDFFKSYSSWCSVGKTSWTCFQGRFFSNHLFNTSSAGTTWRRNSLKTKNKKRTTRTKQILRHSHTHVWPRISVFFIHKTTLNVPTGFANDLFKTLKPSLPSIWRKLVLSHCTGSICHLSQTIIKLNKEKKKQWTNLFIYLGNKKNGKLYSKLNVVTWGSLETGVTETEWLTFFYTCFRWRPECERCWWARPHRSSSRAVTELVDEPQVNLRCRAAAFLTRQGKPSAGWRAAASAEMLEETLWTVKHWEENFVALYWSWMERSVPSARPTMGSCLPRRVAALLAAWAFFALLHGCGAEVPPKPSQSVTIIPPVKPNGGPQAFPDAVKANLPVFTMDYPRIQIPFEITLWVLLASFAKIGEFLAGTIQINAWTSSHQVVWNVMMHLHFVC